MSNNPDRPRSDSGQYTEEITLDETLAIFSDQEPRTAKEVADELGCVRRTAYNKLSELAERGDLERKKVGGRAVVWWRS
jgi:predicted ArsR family transcriptional regulator